MRKMACHILMAILSAALQSQAADFFVSTIGNDADPGTFAQPFATIQMAVDSMQAGDTCYIRGGTYRDPIYMDLLVGTPGNPFRFENYNGEEVRIAGTMAINTSWSVYSGNIYKTTLSQDIWQLFVDNQMAQPARWPNSYNLTRPDYGGRGGPEPGCFWDMDSTRAYQSAGSTYGHVVNDSAVRDLAGTSLDFTGAMLVGFRMIVSGNDVFYEEVTNHSAGQNEFDFSQQTYGAAATGSIPLDQGRYYLTASLSCLDAPGEWYYDLNTGELYLWVEDGTDPSAHTVAGRIDDYLLQLDQCSYVEFKGLHLFSTAFSTASSDHIVFDSCRSSFPSCAKLMLKSVAEAESNVFGGTSVDPSGNTIRNSIIEYTEGRTLRIESKGNLVENCLLHHATWGRANFGVISDKKGERTTYSHCTMRTWGKGNAIKAGPSVLIEYCHAYNAYYHGDNSGFQIPSGAQEGSVVHHNWIHDCVKRNGVRFDGDPAGIRATIYRTVSLRNGKGYRLKGDQHKIMNIIGVNNAPSADVNIAFDKFYGYDPPEVMEYANRLDGRRGSFPYAGNVNSLAANVAGDLVTPDPIPTAVHANFWVGFDNNAYLRDQLRDPDNLDFRPSAGSPLIDAGTNLAELAEATVGFLGSAPDIGAYEYGEATYWIPGYQTTAAQTPVPPDGSTTVKTNADLMWLEGIDATAHQVYFGTTSNLVYQGSQTSNIFSPGTLLEGQTYYWRVDETTPTGTVTGPVWSFTPNPADAPITLNPTHDTFANGGTSSPQGALSYLQVKSSNVGYLQFNASAFSGDIQSAVLRVATVTDTAKQPSNPEFYSVSDNNWDEATLVGANMPATGALITNLNVTFSPDTYYDVDVTSFVTNGAVYSFAIKDPSASNKARWSSKEGDRDPELIITPVPSIPANYAPSFMANTFNKPDAVENHAYVESIAGAASDPDGDPITFSKVGGPAWLSVDADGTLSGTPATSDIGPNLFTVRVTDDSGAFGDADMAIEVVAFINTAPAFTADPIVKLNAQENAAYNSSLANDATDADNDPLTFSAIAGPAWLSVAANGVLSGTPTGVDVGQNSWTVQVSDGNGGTDSAVLNITVDAAPPTTLFSDDFESGDFTTGGWSVTGGGSITTGAAFTGSKGARLKKSATLEKTISTVGYGTITVDYARAANNLNGGENLTVQWSTDGSSWTTLEVLNTTAYAAASFVLPAGAGNQSALRIRFVTNASQNKEKAFIDDVFVIGQ